MAGRERTQADVPAAPEPQDSLKERSANCCVGLSCPMVKVVSTVLVVDDRAPLRRALAAELSDSGFEVVEAGDGREGWERFRRAGPDLVITDLVMPGVGGLELVDRIREHSSVPVIVFSAQASVESAVAALKRGANEFVSAADAVGSAAGSAVADLVALARRCAAPPVRTDAARIAQELVGETVAIERCRERLAALAPLDEPVLLTGEPGTGRRTAARLLHACAPERGGAFVDIGPDERGTARSPVRGTVHLRDFDRFEPEALARWSEALLRPTSPRDPRPRIVASAAPALRGRIERGDFDTRIGQALLRFEVRLPPLRERPEDVPRMARALLERVGRELGRPGLAFAPRALDRLRERAWPGNAAELAGIVEKLAAFATARVIQPEEVDAVLDEFGLSIETLRDRAAEEERSALVAALRETGGNVTRTAERLGRSRAAVYRLVAKHGLPLARGR